MTLLDQNSIGLGCESILSNLALCHIDGNFCYSTEQLSLLVIKTNI
jgi:hypothetical protein